jgi:uncharacterized protein YdgA (DUF945 family)
VDQLLKEKDATQSQFYEVQMEYRKLQAQKYKLDSKSKTLAQEQASLKNSGGDVTTNLRQQVNELEQEKAKLDT